jgi:tetratricopeptide (TPR) repeat protein
MAAATPEYDRMVIISGQDQRMTTDDNVALQVRPAVGQDADPGPLIRSAWEAFHSRQWDEAERRWARLRAEFPDVLIGYSAAVTTLREAGRLDVAEAMAEQVVARFPDQPAALNEQVWLISVRGRHPEAIARWASIRQRFPNEWVPYLGGARAFLAVGDAVGARALLRAGADKFPGELVLLTELAWVAANRRDWPEAIQCWAEIRTRFPGRLVGYISGAQALRSASRFAEAETLLLQAEQAFPDETGPATELAWLAYVRRDLDEAARRWEAVRTRFPDLISGYLDCVHPLRGLKRLADAERILVQAALRFPNDAAPAMALASLTLSQRDWPQAERLHAILRQRFPDQIGGYGGGVLALRELYRFDDADALAAEAAARFPDDVSLRIDHAWLAQSARDWNAAIDRWAAVRAAKPDFLDAYIQASRALRSSWRHEEAEALLQAAMQQFPDAPEPASEYASMALQLNRWDDAQARFQQLRERFPALPEGWQGGAAVSRNQFQLAQAEAMLEQAMTRFPQVPQFALDHAQLPVAPAFAREKNWPETLQRFDRLHAAFPSFEAGFIVGVRALNDAGQPLQAEALARSASERLTGSYTLATQYAEAAEDRRDWPQAIFRYSAVRDRFPDQPGGDVGLARVLAADGRFAEAETMLRETMARLPMQPAPFAEYAELATSQEQWAEALERWTAAQTRFPHEQQFAHRAYEARMRLTDADPVAAVAAQLAPAPMPDPENTDHQVRDLAMQFESLGGRGLGCEFGIFQRDCGAEPLGLLRWADMPYDMLLFALRNRFEDVGSPEQTELFVSAVSGGRGEYCTKDRRGMMFMRAFVYEDQAPFDKMQVSAFNRLRFLTRKLIDDLEEGSKIFVFRLTDRDLTTLEIDELHAAMRAYGHNTLFYVRYEDEAHPNGTVQAVKPGLLVGYMDRFKMSRTDQLSSAPPTASWLAVCRNAYALWRAAEMAS